MSGPSTLPETGRMSAARALAYLKQAFARAKAASDNPKTTGKTSLGQATGEDDRAVHLVPVDHLFIESTRFFGTERLHASNPEMWWRQNGLYAGRSIFNLRSHLRLMRSFFNPSACDVSYYKAWWDLQHR